jgi:phage-related protein
LLTRLDIDNTELDTIGRLVVAGSTIWLQNNGLKRMTENIVRSKEYRDEIKSNVAQFLQRTNGGNLSYWASLVDQYFMVIIATGDSTLGGGGLTEFIASINEALGKQVTMLTQHAQNTSNIQNLGTAHNGKMQDAFDEFFSDKERTGMLNQLNAAQYRIDELASQRKRTKEERDEEKQLKKLIDELERKLNPNEYGDTNEQFENDIKNAYGILSGKTTIKTENTTLFKPNKTMMAYQKSVTDSLADILSILKTGSIQTTVVDMPIQPTPVNHARPVQRFSVKRRSGGSRTQQNASDGGGDSADDPPQLPDGISYTNGGDITGGNRFDVSDSLMDMMMFQTGMTAAVSDQDIAEDNNTLNQLSNAFKSADYKTRARDLVSKIGKTLGSKKEEEKPKSIVSRLFSGAKTLFAPITTLLAPVTRILGVLFKPALALIKKGLSSGVKDVKAGGQMIKEGTGQLLDVATHGLYSKAKNKISDIKGKVNNFFHPGESEGIGELETSVQVKDDTANIRENVQDINGLLVEVKNGIESTKTTIVDKVDEEIIPAVEDSSGDVVEAVKDVKNSVDNKAKEQPSTVKTQNTGIGAPQMQSGGTTVTTAAVEGLYTVSPTPTPPPIPIPANASTTVSGTVPAGATAVAGVAAGGAGAAAAASGIGALFMIGKGIGSALMGITKILMTVIASMAATKTLLNLISKALTKGLKPINDLIKDLTKTLKPLINAISKTLTSLATMVAKIVRGLAKMLGSVIANITKGLEAIVKILEPILDALSEYFEKYGELADQFFSQFEPFMDEMLPYAEEIGEALGNLVTVVTDMIFDIAQPFWELMEPLIKIQMSAAKFFVGTFVQQLKTGIGLIQSILGAIEMGFGHNLHAIGVVIEGIGSLVDFFTHNNALEKTGEKLSLSGLEIIDKGIDNTVNGTLMMLGLDTQKKKKTETNTTETTLPDRMPTNGMNLDGTYGSGDQGSYGTYLNMAKHGCGPLALADAASRRTGSRVDPRSLTSAMYASGNYSTKRGTSVSGFLNAASAMGMGYTPGGVTTTSLHRATPNNPITVIGSGSGFGTRSTSPHYVNVLGTKNGIAYTSNPLTGRIERRSANDIASGALMGLYGSGDSPFNDTLSDLFDELRETAGGLLDIFNFEDDDAESISKKAELESTYKEIKKRLTTAELREVEREAFKQWSTKNPQGTQSPSEYLERWNKHKLEYIVDVGKYKVLDIDMENAAETGDRVAENAAQLYGTYDPTTGTFIGGAINLATNLLHALQMDTAESAGGWGGGGSYRGSGGTVLGTVPTVVKAYEAVGVVGNDGDYNQGGKTHALTINGQTFNERPDCTGLCDSVIDAMGYQSEGMNSASFNSAKGIKDASGNISPDWQFIDNPELSSLQGGDIAIIYKGGNHHGEIVSGVENNKVYGFSYGWEGGMARALAAVNDMLNNGTDAFTATKNNKGEINGHGYYTRALRYVGAGGAGTSSYDISNASSTGTSSGGFGGGGSSGGTGAAQGAIDMSTLSPYYNGTWDKYKDKEGIREYFTAAQQAGMSPAQQALIMATGIWEDNAKKLTGQKSLTKVTTDHNGQRAVGIMNWIPKSGGAESTEYGSTLAEQLNYISQAYFSQEPSRSRGRISNNLSGYANALKTLAGHEATGKVGDPIGPIIDRDLIEGSVHYVGGALVPEGWQTPKGLGKYVGTAADVYNWMVQNGLAVGGGSSYGGGSTAGQIGPRVRSLLDSAKLDLTASPVLNAAFEAALNQLAPGVGTIAVGLMNKGSAIADTVEAVGDAARHGVADFIDSKLGGKVIDTVVGAATGLGPMSGMISNLLKTGTKIILSDATKNAVTTAIDTTVGVNGTIGAGLYDLLKNNATTIGDVISTWLDGAKEGLNSISEGVGGAIKEASEIGEDGVAQTLQDMGSSLFEGGTGFLGSVFDTAGQEFQVLYNGKKKSVQIIKGTAEEVMDEIAAGIGSIGNSLMGAIEVGDTTSGHKLKNYLKGNYGKQSFVTGDAETLMGLFARQMANSAGAYAQTSSSSYSGSSSFDDTTEEEESSTIVPGTTDENYYTAYDSAVDSRQKAQWRKFFDSHASEWSAKTRYGKNPTGWWDAYLTNQHMADYYRTEYNGGYNSQEFSMWYASKFGGVKQTNTQPSSKPKNNNKQSNTSTSYAQSHYGWSDGQASPITEFVSRVLGSGDIPPINESAIQQFYDNYDSEPQSQIVNQYIVAGQNNDKAYTIEDLEKITFNVRAEKVEQLLEDISKKLDSMKSNPEGTIVTPQQPVDESVNAIPEQVTRLARG